MPGFEEAFAEAERAATVSVSEAQRLVKAAKALAHAASDGNLAAWRRAVADLRAAADNTQQAVENALASWRFSEAEEAEYLSNGYATELLDIAKRAGLQVRQEASRLLVYPSVVRIQPTDRSLKVDRTAVRVLRPSRIVERLKAAQAKPPKFKGAQFLSALQQAYQTLTRGNHVPTDTVLLVDVFRVFTIAPGSEYTREEFARDLYLLSRDGPHVTKDGFQVSFAASTGTRSPARLLQTIDEHGQTVMFYALRFARV